MRYIKYIALILASAGALGFYYVNKPTKDISNSSPDLIIKADDLLNDFLDNENAANTKYLDKIIEIEGVVNSITIDEDDNATILLVTADPLNGISCQLRNSTSLKRHRLEGGEKIKIKGICAGMLMDVILVNCIIKL